MNYHNITTDDMLNGDGLRVVLWTAGCTHKCEGCHNPITWDVQGGLLFDDNAKTEIFHELEKDYISGITFSGGDPLHPANCQAITDLAKELRSRFPQKTMPGSKSRRRGRFFPNPPPCLQTALLCRPRSPRNSCRFCRGRKSCM